MNLRQSVCAAILLGSVASSTPAHEKPAPPGPQHASPMPVTPLQAENDRICMKVHSMACHDIPHLLGPVNAEVFGEEQACTQRGVSRRVDGEWKPDNIYRNRETGDRYGDICIAVSL